MNKYYYHWNELKDKGFKRMPKHEWTLDWFHSDMEDFVNTLSVVVKKAKCGWNFLEYVPLIRDNGYTETFMVLWTDEPVRWIPISGNSKGACIDALADNLW